MTENNLVIFQSFSLSIVVSTQETHERDIQVITSIGDLQVRDDVIVTIAGTIVRIREDEFLLQDSTGQVWIEAARGGPSVFSLSVGDRVTVTGDSDDREDFDAVRITTGSGFSSNFPVIVLGG